MGVEGGRRFRLISLNQLVEDIADALSAIDAKKPAFKQFQPGIGPYSENEISRLVFARLMETMPVRYKSARSQRTPDWLIPGEWMIEFKILRPFGDNGREAEHWSQNLLHPYRGNTSTIGDALKLLDSSRSEKKAIIVIGYEHEPAQIELEPCFRGFEILANELMRINLSARVEVRRNRLVHPVHQVVVVCGWQVLEINHPD